MRTEILTPPITARCMKYGHRWRSEMTGARCRVCGQFTAYNGAPWIEEEWPVEIAHRHPAAKPREVCV